MTKHVHVIRVPEEQRFAFAEIAKHVDRCCETHLSEEFRGLCHAMLAEAGTEGVALQRGKPGSWAAGVVFTLARINHVEVDT
jgi:hypothetical protein